MEVIVSIDPHGRLQAPATPPLMVWPLVRVSHAPDRRLAVLHLQALRRTRVVQEVAIVVATKVHDVCWNAMRSVWLQPWGRLPSHTVLSGCCTVYARVLPEPLEPFSHFWNCGFHVG